MDRIYCIRTKASKFFTSFCLHNSLRKEVFNLNHFDFSKEYGLVLEGGGAKGAYQIGVWKALREHGVRIKGVSGVSVGALNGALITMGDYEEAERLWNELTYSKIMDVDDEFMDKLVNLKITQLKMKTLTKDTTKIIRNGGIDIAPLRGLIDNWVDEEKITSSETELVLSTFSLSHMKEVEVSAKEVEAGYLKDYLLASSYLPAFKSEKLHGQKYLDGGVVNGVPIDMLINRGYKNIIVVRIFGFGINKNVKIPDDVTVYEIAPRVNLGGILEFNTKKIRRNSIIGYYDAKRLLCGLKGKIYYLDWNYDEEESIIEIFRVNDSVKMALLEYYKYDISNITLYNRIFIEEVCPLIASTLKLNKDWSYQELLLSMYELSAKTLKVQKYNIYTRDEFLQAILLKYNNSKINEDKLGLFEELIIKLISIRG